MPSIPGASEKTEKRTPKPESKKTERPEPGKPAKPEPGKITAGLKALARQMYVANATLNALKKESDATRTELFAALELAQVGKFDFATTDLEGRKLRLEVFVETPEVEKIEISLLSALVDPETFLKCVSATKANVTKVAGPDIAVRASVKSDGTRNVWVKPAK